MKLSVTIRNAIVVLFPILGWRQSELLELIERAIADDDKYDAEMEMKNGRAKNIT